MSRLLLAVGLCRLCAAYAPIGRRRGASCAAGRVRGPRGTDQKAERHVLWKYDGDRRDSADAASAADSNPLSDLPLWRGPGNALPGERQFITSTSRIIPRFFEKLVRGPKPWYFGHTALPGGSANLRIPKRTT